MKHPICVLIVVLCCIPASAQQASNPEQPYILRPGAVQLAGRFGGSYLANTHGQSQPTAGAEVVVGLPRKFALFAEGTWHSGVNLGVINIRLGTDLFDLGTGLEWSIPTRTRVVPYLRGGVSLVHVSAEGRFRRSRFWVAGNKFTVNAGGGFRVHIRESYGVLFDFRAFDGPNFTWMVRPSVGFFYRFK